MPRYLLSIYQPDTDPPPPEVLAPIMAEVANWRADLKDAGAWVLSAGLHPPHTATVLAKITTLPIEVRPMADIPAG